MKLARRRGSVAGSAASSRSGSAGEQLLEHHPQLEAGQAWPRQKCVPKPNATCSFGSRSMSKRNGSANIGLVAVGRLVEQQQLLALVQLLAHELDVVGDGAAHVLDRADPAQHLLDRGRDPARVGRAAACRWSGCSSSWSMPPVITWRVVSSPPMRMSSDSCSESSWSSRSPSTSACTSTLMRSSVGVCLPLRDRVRAELGVARRRRPSPATHCSSVALPLSALSMSSDQRSRSSRSSGATPSMSPIMIIGSGAAMSQTKSHSPRSHTASMIASHDVADLRSSLSRTRRGVKPRFTSLRRFQCSGSSMSIIIGIGPVSGRMPPAFENVVGSFDGREHRRRSDAMPHTPLFASKYTGAFARIHAYFSPRIVDVEAAVEQVDVVAGGMVGHARRTLLRVRGPGYFGGMRMPASMRITSPFR